MKPFRPLRRMVPGSLLKPLPLGRGISLHKKDNKGRFVKEMPKKAHNLVEG